MLRKFKLSLIIYGSGFRPGGAAQATQHLLGPVESHQIDAGGIAIERKTY